MAYIQYNTQCLAWLLNNMYLVFFDILNPLLQVLLAAFLVFPDLENQPIKDGRLCV